MDKHRLRKVGAAAVMLLALSLSGCWLQLGGGAGNERFNPVENSLTRDNVASLHIAWRAPGDSFITEPIIDGNRIHATSWKQGDDGTLDVLAVRTYDRDSGNVLWQRDLLPPGGARVHGFIGTPARAGDALWVPYWREDLGPCAGRLSRLDPATGNVLSEDVTGNDPSSVVAADGLVAYTEGAAPGCADTRIVVRDQATRAIRWSHVLPNRSDAVPAVANGRLYLRHRGNLYAFNLAGCGGAADCSPVWTQPVASTFLDFLRLTAGPNDNLVTFGQSTDPQGGTTVVVRDGATGAVRWEATPRYSGPLPGALTGVAVAYDTVYVTGTTTTDTGSKAILDAYPLAGCGAAVCSPTWSTDLGNLRPAREPVVAGGVVYVPMVGETESPGVVAVDAHGCGEAACPVLKRVPFATGSFFDQQAQPYTSAIGSGRLLVGWLPGLHGTGPSQLIALAPGTA